MAIPAKVREEAAVLCSAMQSYAVMTGEVMYREHMRRDVGVSRAALVLMRDAARSTTGPLSLIYAEAEAMLRTGWCP